MTMKFTYRFNNVLSLKEKLEENKKYEFATSKKKYDEENEKLNILFQKKEAMMDRWRGITESNHVVTIKELQNSSMNIKMVDDLVEKQKRAKEYQEENLNECRQRLVEAKKQTKIFEKLKEKDYEKFKDIISKSEASIIDQLVSYKNTVKKGG
ncbi:MAG: flagellar export protein FliJ [Clostridiaceae bacterium]|nr:flagellar export protein FliJ [Clostridiaceae bacterium]